MADYQATKIQGETLGTSTTYATLGIRPTYDQFILFQPTTDFRLALNPALIGAVFYDASGDTGSQYIDSGGDLVRNLADRNTANGTGTVLDGAATGDKLYLCFSAPVRGVRVVIGSANSTANTTISAKYRKNDDTWAALSVTDGTDSGGVGLAQTGDITWTAVSDWKSAQLVGPNGIVSNDTTGEITTIKGFWVQVAWDEALDADTEIDELWTINQDVDYAYFRADTEYSFVVDIEVDLASGTGTLQVTWVRTIH
jgi:hypothetical protein